ncbi:MAG: 50S ribosomal protein L6 [Bacilli bacterium]|nr:50S ribosomal protein L6 [Acholeplasmataceae bacterium]MDY2902046.1 50S ribosomal protein L6 [Bacilli bacterium]
MSRIGNKIVQLAAGVSVTVDENNLVVVKGPKGELSHQFNPIIKIIVEEHDVKFTRPNDEILTRALHGTTRALVHNMVVGVSEGFTKSLTIEGVGYRASLKGNTLVIAAGYSHLVEMAIPEGLKVICPSQTEIKIEGIDKQLVGEFAANVRKVRKPEPYKGKGIRYSDEVVRRKEGKKAK